jgi:pilus assembly protein FimV
MLAIASTAGAASLGRLAVLSAIGEPLRAEIDLSVSPEELDSLSPRLAAAEDYAAAGLPYNAALNGARLAVKYRENGRRVIDLVSTRTVNEPAIALIVELNLRGGRITRAYNVLLGPVTESSPREAAPAVAPALVVPVAAQASVQPAPVAKRAPETRPATPAAPRAPRAEKKSALAVPAAAAAAPANVATYDRELNRLESQLNAGDKIIKDMLSRVTVMEGQVAQLQKAFAALPTPAPAKAVSEKPAAEKAVAEKPAVEKSPAEKSAAEPAPVIADPTKPATAAATPSAVPVMQEVKGQTTTRIDTVTRTPHKSDYMLNEALLVLAGGALALFIGLGYVMLGRRRAAKTAEAEAVLAAETQNAG